jgi:hypothetical protein
MENLDRVRGHDQRAFLRRVTDRVNFEQCPKYMKHDIPHEQMVEIVELAMKTMKDQSNIEFAQFIKDSTKQMLPRILVFIGTIILGVIFLLHDKGVFK